MKIKNKIVDCYKKIETMFNKNDTLVERGFLALIAVSIIMMFLRCFFGSEFTDEAYTVSDTLAIMHGNVPYAFDKSRLAGQSFVPILFYGIYELFVPSLEGIFLYSRIMFLLFRIGILAIIYYVLRNEISRKWRLGLIAILIPFQGTDYFNFSYNSIAVYVTFLVAILLYLSHNMSQKKRMRTLFLCGFLTAISVFAHVMYAVAVFIFMLLIFLDSDKDKIKSVIMYCLGGIFEILVVIIPIIIQVGMDKFIYGVESMLLGNPDGYITSTLSERFARVFEVVQDYWGVLFAVAFVMLYLGNKYIRVHEEKLGMREYWILAVVLGAVSSIVYASSDIFYFRIYLGCICVGMFVLLCPLYKRRHELAWYVGIYNLVFLLCMTLFTLNGVDRFIFSVTLVIVPIALIDKTKSSIIRNASIILVLVFVMLQGLSDFKSIYRDDFISNLNTRVESGVYKGIYTTGARARDIVELEDYINSNISDDEYVSFRDNAPVGYLMSSRNICDVMTWDEMQWTYKCDNPTTMYRYYKNTERIPDVIMYIDFGRDESLSIENPSDVFQYNDFVNEYYDLVDNSFKNETFRVLLYKSNGSFDGDYESLINSVH